MVVGNLNSLSYRALRSLSWFLGVLFISLSINIFFQPLSDKDDASHIFALFILFIPGLLMFIAGFLNESFLRWILNILGVVGLVILGILFICQLGCKLDIAHIASKAFCK